MDMRQIKIPEELYHCFEAAGYRQHYEANEDIYMLQKMVRAAFHSNNVDNCARV